MFTYTRPNLCLGPNRLAQPPPWGGGGGSRYKDPSAANAHMERHSQARRASSGIEWRINLATFNSAAVHALQPYTAPHLPIAQQVCLALLLQSDLVPEGKGNALCFRTDPDVPCELAISLLLHAQVHESILTENALSM